MRILVLLALLLPSVVQAEGDTWLTVSGFSYHMQRHRGYNEINEGVGFQAPIYGDTLRFAAAEYRNSNRKGSVFIGGAFTPVHIGPTHTGIVFGKITGYTKEPLVGGSLVMMLEDPDWKILGHKVGADLFYLPAMKGFQGGFALQFKAAL